MIARTHSISILRLALTTLLAVALAGSCALAVVAQSTAQKDLPAFKKVERTVQKLLGVPVYTAGDERLLNTAGDSAAIAITKAVSEKDMELPDTGRRIVLILHLAFEAPQSIIEPGNRSAVTALHLLDELERTDFGRRPNVVANARREIEHNSSTGKPLEFVTFPGEPVVD
jgi:hypothetical protein